MQEPDRDFADLARRFGRRPRVEIWRSLARATRGLARTIRALKIDCDLHARDSVYFTLTLANSPASARSSTPARPPVPLSMAVVGRAVSVDRNQGAGGDRHARQCRSEPRACLPRISRRRGRSWREGVRAVAGGKVTTSRQGVTVQTQWRDDCCQCCRDRDRLRAAPIRAASRPVQR